MRWRPKECKQCKKPATAKRVISSHGLCYPCGIEKQAHSIREMASGTGATYLTWRKKTAEMIRAVLIEDLPLELIPAEWRSDSPGDED